MPHFYERNIVEIKNEYTTFLINIITPFIYEGIKSVYNYAMDTNKKFIEKSKNNPDIKSPGVLKIFQTCLKEIPTLNRESIDREAKRIKEGCKCSDWFDDLVKAVIKSNIVLLTFTSPKDKSDVIEQKYHEKIDTKEFIHKCYIEVARSIYNSPELFWHEFPSIEIKRNQRETYEIIKQSIQEAIRKMLPIKLILMEYLKKDYVPEDYLIGGVVSESQYTNVKNLVKKDIHEINEQTKKDTEYNPRTYYDEVDEDHLEKSLLEHNKEVDHSESSKYSSKHHSTSGTNKTSATDATSGTGTTHSGSDSGYNSNSGSNMIDDTSKNTDDYLFEDDKEDSDNINSIKNRLVNVKLKMDDLITDKHVEQTGGNIINEPHKIKGTNKKYVGDVINRVSKEAYEKLQNDIPDNKDVNRDIFYSQYK